MFFICQGCDAEFSRLDDYKNHQCDAPDTRIEGITEIPNTLTELRLQLEQLAMTGEGLTPSQAILKMLQLVTILERERNDT